MTIKDLKVGMKVFIREDLKVGKKYGSEEFVKLMEHLTGLQKISRVGNKIIEINGWHFTPEMIDWEKTEKINKKEARLTYDGTTLQGQIGGQEIKVVRNPKDEEDLEKAVMMGLLKSLGYSFSDVKRLQNKVKTLWKPKFDQIYYYVGPYGAVESTWNLNHDFDKKLFEACNYFETEKEAEDKAIEIRRIFKK